MTFQPFFPVDAAGQFVFVVRDVDQGLGRTFAEGLDDGTCTLLVVAVESVQRFVENQQVGVLDEGAGQQQ